MPFTCVSSSSLNMYRSVLIVGKAYSTRQTLRSSKLFLSSSRTLLSDFIPLICKYHISYFDQERKIPVSTKKYVIIVKDVNLSRSCYTIPYFSSDVNKTHVHIHDIYLVQTPDLQSKSTRVFHPSKQLISRYYLSSYSFIPPPPPPTPHLSQQPARSPRPSTARIASPYIHDKYARSEDHTQCCEDQCQPNP